MLGVQVRPRRVARVLGVVLALLALTGCGGSVEQTGTLMGYLYATGSPSPGSAGAVSTYPVPGTVTAAQTVGGFVLTVDVPSDGSFTLHLPPGTYIVTGQSPNVVINRSPVPCSANSGGEVTVYANQTRTVDVYCSNR